VGKNVAPDLIRASLASGAGKRKRKSKKGGLSLSDMLESAKPAVSKAVSTATPVAKKLAKSLGKQALAKASSALEGMGRKGGKRPSR
jgi:hypothetical protein